MPKQEFIARDLECKLRLQFSSVPQSCPTLCDPMDCSTPGFPIHHQLLEPTQTHVHCIGDTIQPSHPLSSPSPPAFSLEDWSWDLARGIILWGGLCPSNLFCLCCSRWWDRIFKHVIVFSCCTCSWLQLASLRVLCPSKQCWEVLSSRVVIDGTSWYPEANQWLLGGFQMEESSQRQ